MKSSPPRSTFGTMTGLMSFSVRPAVASIAVRVLVERAHRGIAGRHALALEVGHVDDAAVLAGEEAGAQHIDRADDAQVVLQLAGLDALDHLQHVGHAEVDLAARHHRDQHRLAGGRLHQRVHAALFLQRLGDRRRDGVVKRAGLHGGKPVGLRRGGLAAESRPSQARPRAEQSTPNMPISSTFMIESPCCMRQTSAGTRSVERRWRVRLLLLEDISARPDDTARRIACSRTPA